MAGKTKTDRRAANKSGLRSEQAPKTESEVVEELIDTAFTQLKRREITVTELIKLMQVRKELDEQKIKEIEVRWVGTSEKDDAR